jgi:acetyl coenzyme A synthetase (ADP forming)-like protein
MPAATEGLDDVLAPDAIAVVGASRREGAIGRQLLRNLLDGDVQAAVYPVNPGARSVCGVRAYPSVGEVPDEVDLAVVAVPAEHVVDVAEDCGEAGVGALVVITAGFREVGDEGAQRERRLLEVAEDHGMRVVGPNCMGVLNAAEDVRMNATFSTASVEAGGLAFMSQSGALGLAILDVAEELGLGLSHFVSLGNRVDVSSNDLLAAWNEDPATEAILAYLEHFGNPRNFLEIAREVGRRTPVLAVKSGRSAAGARAAASHTGAMAERAEVGEALFEQCGVVRASTIEELFQLARVFGRTEPPDGPGVAILTNSGGPGVMATDAIAETGLEVADLAQDTRERLRDAAPSIASVANPVDLTAGVGPEAYREGVEALAADESVDAILAIYTPPTFQDDEAVAEALETADRGSVPLLACVLGRGQQDTAFDALSHAGLPTYTFPEAAVTSLAAHADWAQRREEPVGTVPDLDVDEERGRALLDQAVAEGREWLSPQASFELLDAYGIEHPGYAVAASPEATRAAADRLDGPVVVKGIGEDLVHKTEHGAVQLDLATADAAASAHEQMAKRLAGEGIDLEAVLVQEQVEAGSEVLLGATSEPRYGTLVAFGLGGVHAEVFEDVAFRLAPLTDADAARMVRDVDAWPLLEGVRGEAPADVDALEDAVLRVSAMASRHPAIREVDLNPVLAGGEGQGAVAVDVRVRLFGGGEPPRPTSSGPLEG